ncbi:MAG: cytochrome b/b6 domain-containing protein [Anaerolineae bacterium]|nr:cytochrome b/b6 domain-containing protein [Anaerolineae bacterium]
MTTDAPPAKQKVYPRFRLGARIEHFITMTSFTILAITGLPQMFSLTSPIARGMIELMGGIQQVRVIHRYAAFALVAGSVYHLFTSLYRLYVKRERPRMMPVKKDLFDAINLVRYNLGLTDAHPKMPKFNFGEKFEYWALVWGTAVMTITGFMLWNPIATTNLLPGSIIPAALAAHGGEALLAVLAIVIWHMYNVHIKTFNPSMFTGWLPHDQMEEEHALELERLVGGGEAWPTPPPAELARRRRNYAIVSVIAGALVLTALIWLFTFEETAVEFVPVVTREVFSPLSATPVP